jgi:hypothetical protein
MTGLIRNGIGVSSLDSGISSIVKSFHTNREILGEFIEDGDGNKHDGHCDDRGCFSEYRRAVGLKKGTDLLFVSSKSLRLSNQKRFSGEGTVNRLDIR